MTKKPSEKNKAWEKERRDRLNKSFDELAKLLPKYDASIIWSKIEIIQKAIAFITESRTKHEDYLKAQDPKLFKEFEDFVNCIQFYRERNAQLTELLKNAKVPLPPVVLPRLLLDKPELFPKPIDADAACLQKPKRQRNRARKNDAVPKKPEEDECVKSNSLPEDTNKSDPEKDANQIQQSITVVQDETSVVQDDTRVVQDDTKEKAPGIKVHSWAFEENPPQAIPLPPVPPPPAKPIFLRLKKRKFKRKRKLIRRPIVRKCFPHPDRLPRWSGQDGAQTKSKQKTILKVKRLRRVGRKREIKLVNTPLPLREQSVSPTAAFLLSFPVVASSAVSGKNVENAESVVSLENLNNFFTSEEYNQFCDQNSATDEKLHAMAIASLPLESEEKAPVVNKPMTSFSVSAITRPSSPKKRPDACDNQIVGKRSHEVEWISGNKCIRRAPVKSFESSYDLKNTSFAPSFNPQHNLVQHSSTASANCLSFTPQPKPPVVSSMCSTNSSLNHKAFPTQIQSVSSENATIILTSNVEKKPTDTVKSKAPNVTLNSVTKQMPSLQTQLPVATAASWDTKPTTNKAPQPTKVSAPKNISHVSSAGDVITLPVMTNQNAYRVATKASVNSFYSPAKSFFYEYSSQNQPISSLNLSRPAVTASGSQSDPLISSTITTKSQPFLSFPSIKPEFPWLQPCTTAFTMSLTPTASTTTTTAACNSNAIPFDLGSVVTDSLTSTSFTLSLSTSKAFDPALVDAENKQMTDNKSNQGNIFPPCDELQFTPRVTTSLAKQANTHMTAAPKDIWKQEKTKDISDQIFYDCEQSKMQQKTHVNWMTSTVNDFSPAQSAVPLPPLDFVNQCPTSAAVDFGFGCRKDSYDDDNQFINWSPTKPLSTDFSAAYTFENFGSNEAPPNKSVKQIFSVSQLVDQTPSQESSSIKKAVPKAINQKSVPVKQTFSNIYSAESLIAKKDNHRMSNATAFYNQDTSNTQTDYHNMSNYIYSYPNTQSCLQPENDYLGASAYASSTVKTTSNLTHTGAGAAVTATAMPLYESSIVSSSNNYFGHSNTVNTNDPYDPTYFPSNNYNHPAATNWNTCTTKGTLSHSYNQTQIPLAVGYGTVDTACQQNSNASGNLTNFNLSSICPEIDGKDGPTGW